VRRLLSHTSGLTTFARSCSPGESSCLEEEIDRSGILFWPPGEVFDYSNLGYGILGDVVTRASGQSLSAYLQNAIFDPLGMHHCGLELSDSLTKVAAAQYNEKTHARSAMNKVSGTPGASSVRCSAHDLLLFGMFNLKDDLKAHPVLTGADIDEMHRAQSHTNSRNGLQYGLGSVISLAITSFALKVVHRTLTLCWPSFLLKTLQ
jgi:CubicO group peptidase (beta-lactamase class C family)